VAGCKPNTQPKSGSTQGFTQGLVSEMLRVRFAPADDSKLDGEASDVKKLLHLLERWSSWFDVHTFPSL
jgi:hypothetical protein